MEKYIKVVIKSESDLPKEKTTLIAHFKHSGRCTDLVYFDTPDDVKYWLSEVDWYLQPVSESPVPEITDKEIRKHLLKIYKPVFLDGRDINKHFRSCAFNEIKWYRSQIKATPQVSERFKRPEDKEIVEIALLFNDGKLQKSKLRDMVAMADFIIDRLYENGDVMKKSSKE
jgi:hypothetical protein